MSKQVIGGPVVVGGNTIPLSKAIRAGDCVYLSGQVPLKPDGTFETGSIEAQTRVVLDNIEKILGEAGCALSDVIKATVWLADRGDFAAFNKVYAEALPAESAYPFDGGEPFDGRCRRRDRGHLLQAVTTA